MIPDTRKSILWINSRYGFIFGLLWYFIGKCNRYYYKKGQLFYYKMRQKFITKCVRLFNTKWSSFITNCESNLKIHRFCYKIQQLLQILTFIRKCIGTWTRYEAITTSNSQNLISLCSLSLGPSSLKGRCTSVALHGQKLQKP